MRTPCDEVVIRSAKDTVVQRAGCERWILAATILASSMAFIDGTVVNVALPALQTSFHATVAGAQWVVESYGLFLSALILVGGSLGDSLGRRRIFIVGVVIFAIASVACGIATSIRELVIARSVQGVGAALLVPGSLSIISASFDEKTRGQAIGTWSGFTAITMAIGPVLGGWLIQHASWRWAFFINIPLAAAVIAISLWRVPESRSNGAKGIDWAGAFTATLGLGGVVVGLIESVELGWRNPIVELSLGAGIASLIAFVIIEERSKSPMVPLVLFHSRTFTGANLLTLFLYAALGAFFFLYPMNLIQVRGYSATEAGAAALPLILLVFLLSRWSGGLVVRVGPRIPLVAGPLIVALGFALFALPSMHGNYWTNYFPAFMVLGFGLSVTVAPLTTVVMNSVDQDRSGSASGINNAVARVAGVLAIAVLGIIMVHAFGSRLEYSVGKLGLPDPAVREIQSKESRLAALESPAELNEPQKKAVREAVQESFVFGFRVVTLICSALAVISAAMASVMIRLPRPSEAGTGHP
jgi:EmrB/QacA subfamily drug resistance transporter